MNENEEHFIQSFFQKDLIGVKKYNKRSYIAEVFLGSQRLMFGQKITIVSK